MIAICITDRVMHTRVAKIQSTVHAIIAIFIVQPQCAVVERRTQHAVSTSTYLSPSSARCYSSSSHLVRLSTEAMEFVQSTISMHSWILYYLLHQLAYDVDMVCG